MVEKRTCDFSGEEIEPGTGTMYVENDGTVHYFKDSKAEKNFFLGREPRELEWTRAGGAGRTADPDDEETADPEPESTVDDEAGDTEAETGDEEDGDE